jgi:TPR repeat protein
MPEKMIACISLPPATVLSVPIFNFDQANEDLADMGTKEYYPCCGKSICGGCVYSFAQSGNNYKCPFCNSDRDKTDEEQVEELMRRVEVNDAGAVTALADCYYNGKLGLQQDGEKAMELWKQAAKLGSSEAYNFLGIIYDEGGDMKKAKFHYEAAAMAGNGSARSNLGLMEFESGNKERAVKHWMISASAGEPYAMHSLILLVPQGAVSKESIDSTLAAYNNSCAEMRSEARDANINMCNHHNGGRL